MRTEFFSRIELNRPLTGDEADELTNAVFELCQQRGYVLPPGRGTVIVIAVEGHNDGAR